MRLFKGVLAAKELPCLTVMIGKALRPNPALCAGFAHRRAVKASLRLFACEIRCQGIGFVGYASGRLRHLHMTVALMIGERAFRRIDGYLVKIRRAQAG